MTIVRNVIGHIGALALLAGCASFEGFPDRPVSTGDDLKQLTDVYFSDDFRAKYDVANASDDAKRQARNEIINGRLAAYDIQFNRFQRQLHQEGAGVNLSTDAIILGLGAAGAVVSGGTSQLLSAAAGGVTGLRGAIDRDLFFEKTMPVLLQEMNAQRKSIRVQIRKGLSKGIADYPLGQGLADIEAYYFAGTIPGALNGIVESAGAKGAKAEAILLGVVTKEAVTEAVLDGANKNIVDIDGLTDEQALRLVLILENIFPKDVPVFGRELDPNGVRFTNGTDAKTFMKAVTPRLNRTIDNVEKLRDAIASVKRS